MTDERRRSLRALAGAVALVVLYFAVPLNGPIDSSGYLVRLLISLAAIGVSGWMIGLQVKRQLTSSAQAPVSGLLLALIAAVLIFAMADYLIARNDPQQFVDLHTRVDALYFALTTLATVGYGDVHAEGQLARVVISVQLLFNLVVIATGASVLSRHIAAKARERRRPEQSPEA